MVRALHGNNRKAWSKIATVFIQAGEGRKWGREGVRNID